MVIYMIKMIVYTYCLIICDNESGIPQGNYCLWQPYCERTREGQHGLV